MMDKGTKFILESSAMDPYETKSDSAKWNYIFKCSFPLNYEVLIFSRRNFKNINSRREYTESELRFIFSE